MPIKFCSEAYVSGLRFYNKPDIWDSGPPSLKSLPEDLCSGFLRPEKSIDLSRVWTHEPWISRRARYPETDMFFNIFGLYTVLKDVQNLSMKIKLLVPDLRQIVFINVMQGRWCKCVLKKELLIHWHSVAETGSQEWKVAIGWVITWHNWYIQERDEFALCHSD